MSKLVIEAYDDMLFMVRRVEPVQPLRALGVPVLNGITVEAASQKNSGGNVEAGLDVRLGRVSLYHGDGDRITTMGVDADTFFVAEDDVINLVRMLTERLAEMHLQNPARIHCRGSLAHLAQDVMELLGTVEE